MKLQYLIEILFILLSRSKVSAKYLADRFGISIRSVYRYIDELSLIVPIYNTRGRNGGYSISETYKIPASFFTVEESEILTGILSGITDELNSQTLTKILEKVKSISKKGERQTSINFENLIIDGGPWGDVEGYKESITFFEECIEKLEVVHIGYRDRDGNLTERDFEPHALILKQGLWYVYGYCIFYLFIPFFNKWVRSMEKSEYLKFLVIAGTVWSIIPTFFGDIANFCDFIFFAKYVKMNV